MKRCIGILLLFGLGSPALAIDKAELDQRIARLTASFELLHAKPDRQVPAQKLKLAQGIILLDLTRAGFGFAYEGGTGVALVRDARSGKWSAPSFLKSSQASFGFQAGGRQSLVVALLANTNTARMLTQPIYRFGGEASGTAGNTTGAVEGTLSPEEQQILVYTDAEGFYGGAAAKGGSLSPDAEANILYYGQSITPKDILFDKKAKPSAAAMQLLNAIQQASSK